MSSKNIRIIIFLAILGIIGVIVNQFFWVRNSIEIQNNTIQTQKENVIMQNSQFQNQATLALVAVRDELISLNSEAIGMYLEPVQQITKNYFVVSFYDTLNPKVLENLLVEKFKAYNVQEAFEYGIYDCFTDSIIFDKYVDLSSGQVQESKSVVPQQKWNHDGHYFGVYFPTRSDSEIAVKENLSGGLIGSTFVIIIVLLVFSITIITILRQKRLSEVKTDFINNMTHELKTPISTIALSSEVLKSKDIVNSPERIERYAHIISAENARLESQVERVLQLAKLDKGKIELKNETIDLKHLFEKAIPAFKLMIEQRMGELKLNFTVDNAQVVGDRVHLTNVIYNLLDNAIKYSPDAPAVIVEMCNKGNDLVLRVTDQGKGMTKEQSKQVFDRFYRVPTGSVHDVKGFGLGLYYVKEIIKAHKGTVDVKSELNVGSTFTIVLKNA
jgi:two-component system phosphate regulon sensor histidine kinase PhoR